MSVGVERLWFFAVARAQGTKNQQPGVYFNSTKGTPFYTPDFDRPAYFLEWLQSGGGRATWQASASLRVVSCSRRRHRRRSTWTHGTDPSMRWSAARHGGSR